MTKVIYMLMLTVVLSITSYSQIGLQTTLKPNEIAPTFYLNANLNKYYAFQWNFFGSSFIPKDSYNLNKFSGSMYSAYSLPILLADALIIGRETSILPLWFSDSSKTKRVIEIIGRGLFFAIALPNTQHFLNLYSLDSLNNRIIGVSMFLGFQTDYYDQREVNWLRFSPSCGIELFFPIYGKYLGNNFNGYGVGVQAAITRYWDFLPGRSIKGPYLGSLGLKLNFPL